MSSTGAIRQFLGKNPREFDPRKYLAAARAAMKALCKARYEAFGSAGRASRIKAVPLKVMAARYKKGQLDAVVR